ncbi:hypothetical protein J2S34_000217 [Nitrobacter winogradskyi]|uniref:Uncharacterized protein n=1 Tax=Nitrobacter winogradskyi TaxID=913 RepID=A0ACC6AG07_NITWI|nr:hypothetical protein [Nitrobacter winogradskyi]
MLRSKTLQANSALTLTIVGFIDTDHRSTGGPIYGVGAENLKPTG